MITVHRTQVMPAWVEQLSSIHRVTVLKHAGVLAGLEAALREVVVPALTFASLMQLAPSQMIDLLHIDAEGHDAAILDQIDLDGSPPGAILFESRHLSAGDRQRCERRLMASGYRLHNHYRDTLAIRSDGLTH